MNRSIWVVPVLLAACFPVEHARNPDYDGPPPADAGLDATMPASDGGEKDGEGPDDGGGPVDCDGDDECPSTLPVCANHKCVGCIGAADCERFDATSACDTASGKCEACVENTDCVEPTKPICDAHACRSCASDLDCEPLGKICDESPGPFQGQCVQCTQAETDETRCGTKSCDPATRACTQTERGSAGICEACVADSECEVDHRCVAMNFQGTPLKPVGEGGGYCLKRTAAGPCDLPYGATPISRDSLSGAVVDSYCGLNEDKATCDAILQYSRPCSSCEGVPGSLCETVGAIGNRCTYACGSGAINECPESATCPSGTDSYCGKP